MKSVLRTSRLLSGVAAVIAFSMSDQVLALDASAAEKLARKVQASRELWSKFSGSIDTREKFEARRMEMATREWNRMTQNGSAECLAATASIT